MDITMAPAEELIEIHRVTPGDRETISEIARVAADLTLPPNVAEAERETLSKTGFLVSGYTAEKYTECSVQQHLYALRAGEVTAAFLLGYSATDAIDPNDLGSRFIRELRFVEADEALRDRSL